MKHTTHSSRTWSVAALALLLACSARAQNVQNPAAPQAASAMNSDIQTAQVTTRPSTAGRPWNGSSSGSFSVIPYATNGYVGINVGKPDWDLPCVGFFECDESDAALNIYTGGLFNPYLGAELGYVYFGRFERAGGRTRAQGLNFSVVGQLPLGELTLFAKAGAMYGETKVSASPFSGLATGTERGWERSYGAGAAYNLSPRSAVVLEWNRYNLEFVGGGRDDISTTSLGYVHRF